MVFTSSLGDMKRIANISDISLTVFTAFHLKHNKHFIGCVTDRQWYDYELKCLMVEAQRIICLWNFAAKEICANETEN